MKAATVTEIKRELSHKTDKELVELCLRLSKFKKENKELLTYLLYEADDIHSYILNVQDEIEDAFNQIKKTSYYFIAKSMRKTLRVTKKFIRYSQNKQVEVELLIYFCEQMRDFEPSINRSTALINLYDRQIALIKKALATLNEDLQYDYQISLDKL
ncbi:MAG: hypothetical protein JXR10_18100 [Cyclobacteriaceae bacterium]